MATVGWAASWPRQSSVAAVTALCNGKFGSVCVLRVVPVRKLAGSSGVPLQYIVTTTTPPPLHLRANTHTPLKLGGKHGLLFGKALKTARPRQMSIPGLAAETKKKDDEAKTGGGK